MKSVLVHLISLSVLTAMAYLQLNDPDPLYWVSVYLIASLIPATALVPAALRPVAALMPRVAGTSKVQDRIFCIAVGLIVAGLLISGPGFVDFLRYEPITQITASMAANPRVEAAREFLGLVIAWGMLIISGRH